MTLRVSASAALSWALTYDAVDNEWPVNDNIGLTQLLDIVDGTGAGQATKLYRNRDTLSDGASTSYDLAGALTDVFGVALTFTAIKGLMIRNYATAAAANLVVGGGRIRWSIGCRLAAMRSSSHPAGVCCCLTLPPQVMRSPRARRIS